MIWTGSSPSTIVFITVDALRYDALSWMPTLQALADDNTVVQDCYSAGSNTPTAMPSIMQSRLPTDYGLIPVPQPLPSDLPTLSEYVNRNGYFCIGLHSNPYLGAEFNFDKGFDVFSDLFSTDDSIKGLMSALTERLHIKPQARRVYELLQQEDESLSGPYTSAKSLTDTACDYISDSSASQTFYWLHYMDTHHPYLPPERYREHIEDCPTDKTYIDDLHDRADDGGLALQSEAYNTSERNDIQALYRGEAEYVDDQLNQLLETIQNIHNWSETLLIITSDHGELLGNRHAPGNAAFGHPGYLCEELTHVPLIYAGGQVPDQCITNIASSIDIAPTVASAVGTSYPQTWKGAALGSDEFIQRERIQGTVLSLNAYDDFEESTLHAYQRTDDHVILWWAAENKQSEYYHRGEKGERILESETAYAELSDQNDTISNNFSDVAEKSHGTSEEVMYGGYSDERTIDINKSKERRLADLGYL
jgi:arylsulfatase A-like enzyme